MTINAIETHYAGHRFRSRLEARYAVLFTASGWTWDYEPQGFVIDDLAGEVWSGPYLPDFKIRHPSGQSFWVEVKGEPSKGDVRKAAACAIPHGGLPACDGLKLFGPLGHQGERPAEENLTFHKGDVMWRGMRLASDGGFFDEEVAFDLWISWSTPLPGATQDVVTRARSARFEHGERP